MKQQKLNKYNEKESWNFSLLQLIELTWEADCKNNLKANSGCSCEIKSIVSVNNLYIFNINL